VQLSSSWAPQILGFDAMTVLALAARDAPGIELGIDRITTAGHFCR
jgi:hypothetical protein